LAGSERDEDGVWLDEYEIIGFGLQPEDIRCVFAETSGSYHSSLRGGSRCPGHWELAVVLYLKEAWVDKGKRLESCGN
jgi:hypothetical protein